MRWLGPAFVVLAVTLVSMCTWVFYSAVYGEAYRERSTALQRFLHGAAGVWVVSNIAFNYVMCILTPAGSTKSLPIQALSEAYPPATRWCRECERPKPALTHHCSVCGACVLLMDHHCPWVANCVGLRNYRYFFLFLFWLTFGCIWAFPVLFNRFGYRILGRTSRLVVVPTNFTQVHAAHGLSPMLALLLTGVAGVAVGGMLAFHAYLVATAQGTIDLYRNRESARAARRRGGSWRNVYDLGIARNWRQRFGVSGPLWWLAWTLPRLEPPALEAGYRLPVIKDAEQFVNAATHV